MIENIILNIRKSTLTHLTSFFLLIISFFIFLIGMSVSATNVYDEGLIVYGAQRVVDGDVPYKDFWSIYSPAQFWVLGGLFKAFGSSVLVERIFDISIRATISLMVYILAKKYTSNLIAISTWALSTLWLWHVGFYGFPVLPSLLFILISSLFFINFISSKQSTSNLFYAGGFAGVAALFRHDLGFYVFTAQVVSILLLRKSIYGSSSNKTTRYNQPSKDIIILSLAAAIIGTPALIYLFSMVPAANIIDQLIMFPATIYREVRHLPYPSLYEAVQHSLWGFVEGRGVQSVKPIVSILPYYLNFIVVLFAAFFLASKASNNTTKKTNNKAFPAILYLSILVMLLFIKSTVRPHYIHLIQVIVPTILLGGIIAYNYYGRLSPVISTASALLALMMAVSPAYSLYSKLGKSNIFNINCKSLGINKTFDRADCFHIGGNQQEAINYIRLHTEPSDKIYVGNISHKKVFINDILFYFLSERDSATMYHELHPGQITTNSVQLEVIRNLKQWEVKYVVLQDKYEHINEPNGSSLLTTAHELDNFIANNYLEVARFGSYSIRHLR